MQTNSRYVVGGVAGAATLWVVVCLAPWAVVGAVAGALAVVCVAALAVAWHVPPCARVGYVPPVRTVAQAACTGGSMWGSSLQGRASSPTVRR